MIHSVKISKIPQIRVHCDKKKGTLLDTNGEPSSTKVEWRLRSCTGSRKCSRDPCMDTATVSWHCLLLCIASCFKGLPFRPSGAFPK